MRISWDKPGVLDVIVWPDHHGRIITNMTWAFVLTTDLNEKRFVKLTDEFLVDLSTLVQGVESRPNCLDVVVGFSDVSQISCRAFWVVVEVVEDNIRDSNFSSLNLRTHGRFSNHEWGDGEVFVFNVIVKCRELAESIPCIPVSTEYVASIRDFRRESGRLIAWNPLVRFNPTRTTFKVIWIHLTQQSSTTPLNLLFLALID